jgi:Ca2+/Na+ antiporter
MSDQSARSSVRPTIAVSLAAGAVSGLLYSTLILSPLFLVPAQIAYGRGGRAAGAGAAGVSAAVIAASIGLLAGRVGYSDPALLAAAIAPPLVLLLALMLMNASFWDGRPEYWRPLAAAGICVAFAVLAFATVARSLSVEGLLEKLFSAALPGLGGGGYEATAEIAGVDVKEFARELSSALVDSFAASFFLILGGSWRIGNRMSGSGAPGRALTCPIDELRLPFGMIWSFLATWAAVAAVVLLKAPAVASAVAWNCASIAAMAYAAQGIGVATHLLKRWKIPRPLRIALAATLAVALLTPPAGTAAAIAIALLGVTETWIPYRNLKESEHESNS